MAFVPTDNGDLELRSQNYPGRVALNLEDVPDRTGAFWGAFARGAALALKEEFQISRGIKGLLNGMLPGCGLSSSASVLLAYLHALAQVNAIDLEPWDLVRLTQKAENQYIGLNNGILDQTSIVFGRRGHLLHIDTRERQVEAFPDTLGKEAYCIVVAYSGYSRELTTTGYNTRVEECREAASLLGRWEGNPKAEILSDVSEAAFQRYGKKLPPHLFRRAHHFFSEVKRVEDGLAAWQEGRLDDFGRLMFDSCRSSIEHYECGSQAIHDLQQIVGDTDGIIGSRFSGGGFGGCVIGFVDPARAEDAVANIQFAYQKCHPEVADHAAVYFTGSTDGVKFL
jgi:galactokinase/galacturonokinase